MYTQGERLAFGHGDLHLPVGFSDIPSDQLMAVCTFSEGAVFNRELDRRYWNHRQACVDATRAFVAKVQFSAR